MRHNWLSRSLIALFCAAVLAVISINAYACTIAVIGGGVTSDGRPLLWKNRDVNILNQGFKYYAPISRPGLVTRGYIGNYYTNDTTKIYMGINDAGFGIVNSNTYNITTGLLDVEDGVLMRLALQTCVLISDFQRLLDSTNVTGRDKRYNFGVIDFKGDGAMYECTYNHYVKLSIDNQDNQIIIRTNTSRSGDHSYIDDFRRCRAESLIYKALDEDAIVPQGLDAAYILQNCMRDLANVYANPYPLPYNGRQRSNQAGYIFVDSAITICNRRTTSAAVIRGVLPDEDVRFSAMFAVLGQPLQSVAFPMWIGAKNVPVFLNLDSIPPVLQLIYSRHNYLFSGSPNFVHSHYLRDFNGSGIFNYVLPLELWGIQKADSMQNEWQACPPSESDMRFFQMGLARRLYYGLLNQTTQGILGDR
jgi:hypothetical protein